MAQEEVKRAAGEALLRLQAGEAELAIHPNCGTNLTVSVLMVTAAALVGSAGPRRKLWDRITTTALLALLALFAAQPLGLHLQRFTTEANVTDRGPANVELLLTGRRRAYRVTFE